MGFSATGHLLSGSMHRPDTVTLMFLEHKKGAFPGHYSSSTRTGSTLARLNFWGYVPGVSFFTGLGRALLGIVHTIVHLACAIFSKNRGHHLEEAKLGAKNIGRGVIEAIPFIGNITMYIVDLLRINKFEKMAKDIVDKDKTAYDNHAVMFIYGQEIAKRQLEEFNAELEKLKNPTEVDMERIIRNKA